MNDIRSKLLTHARALWRRRWYAILVAWVVSCLGWAYVVTMPDQYESSARVYVNTETMLEPLLKGIAVSYDMNQQLAFMKQTLLSRPNLTQVVRTTDLGLQVENDRDMEQLIEKLSKEISIRSEGQNLLSIAYTNDNPRLAQRVTQSLLNIFVENNLGENRADMENAQTFLENQVAEYERKLRQAEKRLADFKAENIDFISDTGTFVARAETARQQLLNAQRALEDSIAERNRLREQLASVPEYLTVESAPQVVVHGQGPTGASPREVLGGRIQERQADLDRLLSVYTDKHPDVLALKRQIESLQQQYDQMEDTPVAADGTPTVERRTTQVPNSLYEQVKLRLVEAEARVASNERRVRQAEADAARSEELAKTAPEVEAKLADLNRDYGVIKSNYEALLARRESASIAQAVDTKKDVQFRIVDPPEVPSIPSGPNRPLFLSIVVLAGIGGGVGFALLLSQMDDSFSSVARLREAYGLPVLGAVSSMVSKGNRRWHATELAGFAASFVILCGIYAVLVVTNPKLSLDLSNLSLSQLL
ncbi:MAG: chain-length determining protein [Rhodospirillaceae bacterium]|nr:chain-length determining protein [Rhodospirillaceae bacterium]